MNRASARGCEVQGGVINRNEYWTFDARILIGVDKTINK